MLRTSLRGYVDIISRLRRLWRNAISVSQRGFPLWRSDFTLRVAVFVVAAVKEAGSRLWPWLYRFLPGAYDLTLLHVAVVLPG